MGIRFYCPNGHRLNVKSYLAGKRGICPHCEARFRIPEASEIPPRAPRFRPPKAPASPASQRAAVNGTAVIEASPADAATKPLAQPDFVAVPAASDPIAAAPEAAWYVRPASGGEFGPATDAVMRRWIAEGRVGADTLVWREGWAEWRMAGPLFPSLPAAAPSPPTAPSAADAPAAENQQSARTRGAAAHANSLRYSPARRRRTAGLQGKSVGLLVVLGLLIVALSIALVYVLQRT